ncbi:phosphatidylinositol-specific phospholipase C/glycerophosphodiester phosphodiesterase family protein [Anaerotignum sp. MB30-C6]|uniref:phosphatidylinositol-specific phospholipase C/glycerophosphodiester phosphodiesterase family protein n=1 Tax=Anaerotignum sp. MB30-C6 TaxID=3070814 RepID=UPI0027DCA37E|nr:phosphatidylinositol-specific phospholipase C/glycerophosphodiester phosphodiesterase family protein [Anaerotignum sp. MB30-C6]WMI81061.1 phosphatidylinositol-specific phospholipase C/glycerophosphodiester phosphodiesterase family protein [Anaerotignum sp. MB30-C6]
MFGKRMTAVMLATMLGTALPLTAYGGWQQENPLIAHALGEVDGKIETNSKEAFLASWGNGFRALEIDFTYTSDGVLVARHDFEEDGTYYRLEQDATEPLVMDKDTYQNSKIIYEQTPITAVDVLGLMAQYPDVYLITDTKETDKETVQKQFGDLKKIAEAMEQPQILERIVPQIYHEEMYDWVQEIYPFQEWIYTLYLNNAPDYTQIADFCVTKGIGTVTIHKDRVTQEVVDTLHGKGIIVYAHTINRYKQFEELLAMGVDGIYTDRIKPYELKWVGLSDNRQVVEKTVTFGEKSYPLDTLEIFNEDYVPLRQLAKIGKGFSAQFDGENKTLNLASGKAFTSLGNELLLDHSGKRIMEKADFRVFYDGKETKIYPILVDGEVYVSLGQMKELLGFVA